MSLEKAIKHGKEKRKPYHKSKRFDKSCRPGGRCSWCRGNRLHKHKKQAAKADHKCDGPTPLGCTECYH